MERFMVIVVAGKVTKKLVVDPADTATIEALGGVLVPEGVLAEVGYDHDGVNFSFTPPAKTPEQIAREDQDLLDRDALTQAKADATVRYLVTHTPAECYDKVMADVGTLAQAKEMMARLAMAVSAGLRKQLR